MTRSKQRQNTIAMSGDNAYAEVNRLSKKLTTDMLVRMIVSAGSYRDWSLSQRDAARLAKLLKQKQRSICSSFSSQLNLHFNEFKSGESSPTRQNSARKRHKPGSAGAAELSQLQALTEQYHEDFKDFDRTILKRLQACIKRSRASISENPLQIKSLCEYFHHAVDGLKLDRNFKKALYHLFADRFVECLGPLYRRVDHFLFECGMLPDVPTANLHLRSILGMSVSKPPKSIEPDQSASLLILLQRYKEISRHTSKQYKNLFPELKKQFAHFGINQYNDLIDQLQMTFKLIFADSGLPAPAKQQLARLQILIFTTAIHEEGFLRRRNNQAQRLLEGIIVSEVEIAKRGHGERSGVHFIRDYIDDLVSRKFVNAECYSDMFDGYLVSLKQNKQSSRNSRRAEAARKVLPMVKNLLNDLTRPLRVQGTHLILFEKVWLPLLVQIVLQQGKDSNAWKKTILMVKRQVWSLIPKSTIQEKTELLKALPMIEHSLHRAMRSLKLADSLQLSLRDYLKLEQQEVIEKTEQNVLEAKRRTESLAQRSFEALNEEDTTQFDAMMQTGVFQVPADMMEELKAVKPAKPKKINRAEALTQGEWVNMMHQGEKILAKLAWKADDSTLFIFVDREGTRICEIDVNELIHRFDTGAVTLLDSVIDSEKNQFSFMKSI